VHRPPQHRRVKVTVPASSANLGAGFDVLAMALTLYLTVELETAGEGEATVCGEAAGPEGEGTRLVRDAMKAGLRLAGLEGLGYRLTVQSAIPLARGLGSSAALRVGCLVAAARLAGAWSPEAVLAEAARLDGHADNAAAALLGGLAAVAPGGSPLRWARFAVPEWISTVVAVPAFVLATSASRALLPESVLLPDAVFNLGRLPLLLAALVDGRLELLQEAMRDRLHQRHRLPTIPGAQAAIRAAYAAGARGAALSGSGPSVIALCDREDGKERPVADAMAAAFRDAGAAADCLLLTPDNEGVRVTVDQDGERPSASS
jgi:homoserine kinase